MINITERKNVESIREKRIREIKPLLQGKSLFIATPMYGGNALGMYDKSMCVLSAMAQEIGLSLMIQHLYNESLVNRARNYLLQLFLDSPCTHIMWIDADIGFDAWDVINLLAYCDKPDPVTNKQMDIVGGLYPKKNISAEKIVQAVKAGLCDENPEDIFNYGVDLVVNVVNHSENFDLSKPIEVKDIGTGFMLMSKESVNKIRRDNPELKYFPDHVRSKGFDGSRPIYNVFEVCIDAESKRLLSEDYGFLRLAKKAGLNCFVFPWIKLVHVGSWIYQGDLISLGKLSVALEGKYYVHPSGPLVKIDKPVEK